MDNKAMDLSTEKEIDWIVADMKTNLTFAKENHAARECFTQITELMNDLIDHLGEIPKEPSEVVKSCKSIYLMNVLMPASFGIYMDFLAGNVPVCFMQLRMIIESMAEYFEADRVARADIFFYEKLQFSAEMQKRKRESLSKLIDEVDGEAAKVWHKCSDWMHSQALAKKFVEQVAERGVPAWGLVIPMEYTEVDEQSLVELTRNLNLFRTSFSRVLKGWK